MKTVVRGQPVRFEAAEQNQVVRVVNHALGRGLASATRGVTANSVLGQVDVWAINQTGAQVQTGQPISLPSIHADWDPNDPSPVAYGDPAVMRGPLWNTAAAGKNSTFWGIVATPATGDDERIRVTVAGLAWTQCYIHYTVHRWANLTASGGVESVRRQPYLDNTWPVPIKWQPVNTGTQWVMVQLPAPTPNEIELATTDQVIDADQTGDVLIEDASLQADSERRILATHDSGLWTDSISQDKRVLLRFVDPVQGSRAWQIIGAECEEAVI